MHTPARVALGLLVSILSLIAPATFADDNVTATKSVSGSFVQGTNVTYTIVMTNNMAVTQPDNPGNEFRDPMPSGLMFVSASASSGTANYLTTIDTVGWDGSIPAGGSVTLTITATINPAATGMISNQGQTFFDADGNGSNESSLVTDDPSTGTANDATSFMVLQSGTVSATKSVSGTFVQGTDVTYTIVMTNNMTVTQGDNYSHEFTDGLPDDLAVAGVSATSGTIVNFGNVVLWDGTLAAGESVTMTIVATISATASGTISNQGQTIFDRDGDNVHNESSKLTDDPSTGAAHDATSFNVIPSSSTGAFEFSAANYDAGESTTTFDVTVNRTGGSSGAADVTFSIAAGTAQGADFDSGGGTLSFADGETSKTFAVTIVDDGIDEPDQTIALSLSDPTNGTSLGAQSTATITIQDDDAPPTLSIDDVTLTEGDSGSQQATFTITKTGDTEFTVTVTASPTNGTSTCCGPGNDWSGPITGMTFNPSTTTRTAQLTIFGDLVYELDDVVNMDLSNAVNATIDDGHGELTIINNDAPPVFSIDDVTLTEGDSGTQQATFTITKTGATELTATVTATPSAGTASCCGVDYSGPISGLTFNPSTTTRTAQLTIFGDTIDEPDETVFMDLSDAVNATIGDGQGLLTIVDNDAAPQLVINDLSVTEGNSGTSQASLTVSLVGSSSQTVTFDWTLDAGTATCCGNDFSGPHGSTSFPPGITTRTISATIFGDTTYEPDETVLVNLANATNATIADDQGVITILNDDPLPQLVINDISVTEGNSGTSQVSLTVSLVGSTSQTVTIDWTLDAGTATCCGNDFSGPHGSTSFPPGITTRTISATIFGDTTYEPDETVLVNLANATNATIADDQGVITILNDDPLPQLVINDISVNEGNSGTSQASLTVSLVGSTSQTVEVSWTLDAGTATCCGNDFSGPHGTTTFPPGVTTRTISATIFGDTVVEPDETILVNLYDAVNATINDNQGVITILNDDAVQLEINDISVNEGNSGTSQASLTVSLVGGSTTQTVTVDWTLDAGTATCCGNDFSGPHGTLTFPPGITTRTISATIFGDTTVEPDETILVNLSNATNATINDNQGVITILNDDAVQLEINDLSVNEGNSGTSQASLTVSLVGGSTTQTVTVDWTLDAGTATCCGNDFSGPHGTLTFPPGITTRTISATIFGDTMFETDETVLVNLSNAVNATISDAQGVITILNDDAPPQLVINDISVTEGNSGTSQASLTVTLVGSTSQAVTVDWTLDAGTATCCGNDFSGPHGTLTFPVGTTTRTISATIFGDTVVEPDETILVNLSNATNATISDNQGVITILNDDAVQLTINDVSVTEGHSGTSQASLTVSLVGGSTTQTVSVDWTLDAGTATCCGNDFSGPNGTLTFPPGITTRTISATIFGDNAVEPDETILVNLSNAVNATISDNQGVITILNDDVNEADLSLTMSYAPSVPGQNDTVTYTLVVSNSGQQTATNVVVTNDRPDDATFQSVSTTQGSCTTADPVVCSVGTLANGASATITLVVKTPGTYDSMTNSATATSDLPDPTPASASATFTCTKSNGKPCKK